MTQTMGVNHEDFDYLRQLIYQHSAIVLDADKTYLAELHLEPVAALAGFTSITAFLKYLQTHPFGDLHVQAIEALVTTETSFFRDLHPFSMLQEHILPDLIQKRSATRSLNIWCAACSTGQEPYSIALLLREHFPSLLTGWSLRLVASDFSSKVLARARQGRYTSLEIKRGLPKALWEKYFYALDSEWQMNEDVRRMVEFYQINLMQVWPPLPLMDIIFLRNILIYFDTPTKKSLLEKIHQQLKPDGYLFLGGGETTINLHANFERIKCGNGIYHRLRQD